MAASGVTFVPQQAMPPPPPGLPRTGQPDTRTPAQKANRLQYLINSIRYANDGDVLTEIIDQHPLIMGCFNLLVRADAHHGFVRLILRDDCQAANNINFVRALARRIPALREALRVAGNNVDRKEVVHKVLKRSDMKHQDATFKVLEQALRYKNAPWAINTCSGCLCSLRTGYKEDKHRICRECFVRWCTFSDRYHSQEEVDSMWLGVYTPYFPGYHVRPYTQREFSVGTFYLTEKAKELSRSIHGIELDRIQETIEQGGQLQLARNLCNYSATLICQRHRFGWEGRYNFYTALGTQYRQQPDALDILEFTKMGRLQINDRLHHLDVQTDSVQELLDMGRGAKDEQLRKLSPVHIRNMCRRHGSRFPAARMADLLILEELQRLDARPLSEAQSRLVAAFDQGAASNQRVTDIVRALANDFNNAVVDEFWRLEILTRGTDWRKWYNMVNHFIPGSVRPTTQDFSQAADRILFSVYASHKLNTTEDTVRLILHFCAAYQWNVHLCCPRFLRKVDRFLDCFEVHYRLPSDTDLTMHLGAWFSRFLGRVTIHDSDEVMPAQNLAWSIGNTIFIYRHAD